MKTIRRHPGWLVNPNIGVIVTPLSFKFTESGDVDVTVQLFMASSKMRILSAKYIQSVDATAVTSYTALLQNVTGSVSLAALLDIKALGADAPADFDVVKDDDAAGILAAGDIVQVVFNETGGTATSPEVVFITIEVAMLE